MMPSIKALIRNECSAQNAMHNGMTPQDAGHVILNLLNLWEPCTELTFESLESQAKQDHSAPTQSQKQKSLHLQEPLLHTAVGWGCLFQCFLPTALPWGGRSWFGRWAGDQPRPSLLVLPKPAEPCSSCSQGWDTVFHTHHGASGLVFHKIT